MERFSFGSQWEYENADSGEPAIVDLPHDATLNGTRDPELRHGWLTAYYRGTKCRYRKEFPTPAAWIGKTVLIEFEGVYRNATVRLNGQAIANRTNGYVPFSARIDGLLRTESTNFLIVDIDTPEEGYARWYAGSGIHREVFIHLGGRCHVPLKGLHVKTLRHDPPTFEVCTEIQDPEGIEPDVIVDILDGERIVAQGQGTAITFTVPGLALWSAESPALYKVRVRLVKSGTTFDEAVEAFGVRSLGWSASEGLLVNGVRTLLRGGCIHNDNGILGMMTTRATEERRARIIKESGFTAIRSAHHPISPALAEACDRIGLFVMDEAFDSWYRPKTLNDFSSSFADEYLDTVRTMARYDMNHPSIIVYSLGNEIPEFGARKAKRYAKEMIEEVRSIDPTRPLLVCPAMRLSRAYLDGMPFAEIEEDEFLKDPANREMDRVHYRAIWMQAMQGNASNEYPTETERQDERFTSGLYDWLDLAGYNYYGERFERLHELHPERVIVGTETEGNKLAYHWSLMNRHPYVIGDFIWTLQDHLGECNVSRWRYGEEAAEAKYPWRVNAGGSIDLLGHPTPTSFKYRLIWGLESGLRLSAQPPIHGGIEAEFNDYRDTDAIESWSFSGCEGQPTCIDATTDADSVEIWINGVSLGRRPVEGFRARYPATYFPGIVVGVGYDSQGRELHRTRLRSAGSAIRLAVASDKGSLKADGSDFCFLAIDVVDDEGVIHALPEHRVRVSVTGCGTLAGCGSAAPSSQEKFSDPEHVTYFGRCLAAVRSTTTPGRIQVKIQCEGAQDFDITLLSS